jgi:phosphatidylglycerophosphate synthase
MRTADLITLARIVLIVPIVYLVLLKVNPAIPIILLAASIAADGLDGFAALHSQSKGAISFMDYLRYSLGDNANAKKIKAAKASIGKTAKFGPRMDIAGDRITEYSLWALFLYLQIVPLIIVIAVVMRHSIADALMASKGTSSKMKTRFAQMLYSSNIVGRAGSAVMKLVAFSYLMLAYIQPQYYPMSIGYALIAILVLYIMVKGAAEIYESLHD